MTEGGHHGGSIGKKPPDFFSDGNRFAWEMAAVEPEPHQDW